MHTLLSVVIPCYNEEKTLEECVARVQDIADDQLSLEIIIVDDCSRDKSLQLARSLAEKHEGVIVLTHEVNQGKGAALRTGFAHATGDYVAVQDADLEYDPNDLKQLLGPLQSNKADVVLGSRFLSAGAHRVFYFWHSMGNKFLTLLSNMYTDLNLTDMETCYKIFKREIIQSIEIKENRFGFEPQIVSDIAHRRLRIYEMGISYDGRSYAEGKKIGVRDGFRAIYCIFRYNAYRSATALQFLLYLLIGGCAAGVNLVFFGLFLSVFSSLSGAVLSAFFLSAVVDYLLCISLLFRRGARWSKQQEVFVYAAVAMVIGGIDLYLTQALVQTGVGPLWSKLISSLCCLVPAFIGRKYFVFLETVRSRNWT